MLHWYSVLLIISCSAWFTALVCTITGSSRQLSTVFHLYILIHLCTTILYICCKYVNILSHMLNKKVHYIYHLTGHCFYHPILHSPHLLLLIFLSSSSFLSLSLCLSICLSLPTRENFMQDRSVWLPGEQRDSTPRHQRPHRLPRHLCGRQRRGAGREAVPDLGFPQQAGGPWQPRVLHEDARWWWVEGYQAYW